MRSFFRARKRWSLAIGSAATFWVGVFALTSCGGEGGPIGGGGGGTDGSITREFLALLPAGQANAQFVGSQACQPCHNGQNQGDPYFDHWQQTVHASRNVGCESCHGPGGNHVANPSTDNILNLPKVSHPVVCGQCHGPTFTEFMASGHSNLVTSPVHDTATNPNQYGRNSRCGSCHSGLMHIELTEQNVNWATVTDAEFRRLAEETMEHVPFTASCGTCHNPHMKTGNLDKNGRELMLRKPVFNTDISKIDPGSPASEFTTFEHLCGQCHNGRGANPSDQTLTTGVARPNMHDSNQFNMLMGVGGFEGTGPVNRNTAHATAPGQCTKCHMGDGRHTFTVSFDTGCQPCHTTADAAARASTVKNSVTNSLFALRNRMENWALATFGDTDLWDYTSVIQSEGKTAPNQNLVPLEVKRARHNYYFVLRDGCFGVHNAPYANHLITVAHLELDNIGISRSVGTSRSGELSTAQKAAIMLDHLKKSRIAEKLFANEND